MERGDIYLISLDPTKGHEQQGKRPVLVISPKAFNIVTQLPIVLPITTGGKFAQNIGFSVVLKSSTTTGIVRCDQPRSLDFKARHAIYLESIDIQVLDEVMARYLAIFEDQK
ncbi:mRNA interferase MazF/mRNA interferase ChpB [Acinetobacter calcoaceticus]|uniref:mRNA interferase MazF/mRNA interferase ChpB n=1 Tax=Acinetobacter calcoaceticus TaxID=471 RepID=A0A4R1XVQ2_ACICA|nr:mRNA interferase MazF/mRNA interferase ChpB [Acinetobacter calcoaceticus]